MICLRCGCENFGIIKTERNRNGSGKYSARSDRRLYVCKDCEKAYWVSCEMHSVVVYKPDLIKSEYVPVDEYQTSWLPSEQEPPSQQQQLFE